MIFNWRTGANRPPDIETLERVLFGTNATFDRWKEDFRRAWYLAASGPLPQPPVIETIPVGSVSLEAEFGLLQRPIFYGLPRLPSPYREPVEDLRTLRTLLTGTENATLGISGAVAGLHGMGGIGKTVLATALVHDHAVHAAFSAGIVWLTFGRDAQVRVKQEELVFALSGRRWPCRDVFEGRGLIEFLAQQLTTPLLLVLDDIWDYSQPRAAFSHLGPNIRVLVTSRDRRVLDGFEAVSHLVGLLDPDASLDFLALASGWSRESLPVESGEIARRCAGLILALAAVAALIREETYDWRQVLEALNGAKLDELPVRWRADVADANVASILKLSIDALAGPVRDCLYDFAVLQEDAAISEEALANLWKESLGSRRKVRLRALEMVSRTLLLSVGTDRYAIHDLYRDFLRDTGGPVSIRHQNLVERYRATCVDGWSRGPDDGYLFEYLIWHLVEAGRTEEANLLLFDPDWLSKKIKVAGVSQLISDYRLGAAGDDGRRVESALRLAAIRLAEDPDRLVPQICGRLRKDDGKQVAVLLDAARKNTLSHHLLPAANGFLDVPGQLLRLLAGHKGIINDIAVTGDGRRAASASEDRTLIVWDIDAGIQIRHLTGHSRGVNAVAFLESRNQLLSGSDDGSIILWDLDTADIVETLPCSDGSVDLVAVLPDQWRAISASSDGGMKLWDIARHCAIGAFEDLTSRVTSLAVSEQGHILAGTSEGAVVLCDPIARKIVRRFEGHTAIIRAVAFLPKEGAVLAVADDRSALVWNEAGALILRRLLVVPVDGPAVAVLPGDHNAVSGLNDGTLRIWDLFQGRPTDTIEAHGNFISAVRPVADQTRLLSGSHDETLRLWDLSAPPEARRPFSCDSGITTIACTPDGRSVVTGSEEGSVRVWGATSGEIERTFGGHHGSVQSIAVLADGRWVVSGAHDGFLRIGDLVNPTPTRIIETGALINKIVALDDRRVVVGGEQGRLAIWDVLAKKVEHFEGRHDATVTALALSPSGAVVMSGDGDGGIRMWDVASRRMIAHCKSHVTAIQALRFVGGDGNAASGSSDGELRHWNFGQEISVRAVDIHGVKRDASRSYSLAPGILDIQALGMGNLIALCCGDSTFRIFDLIAGREFARFEDDHLLTSSTLTSDGAALFAANLKGRIHHFERPIFGCRADEGKLRSSK